jgi:two-component system response regulator HydG
MSNGSSRTMGRIMVVDDDLVTARFMVHVLGKRGGFEVCHAPDSQSALDMAGSQPWDLVITDVEMPGMSGLELLRALREIAPDLPVAVITGHASVDYAVQAIRSDADEFLEKPVHPDELITAATALVNKGRANRHAARDTVLAVGAHPDDVEIGAGGTLLVHKRLGDAVAILTLSHGARGASHADRAQESRRAAEIIGADLYLDELEDAHIGEGEDTVAAVARVVAQVRPTVVYTHSLHDVHSDHRNAHRAVMAGAAQAARVYCFQSPSATVDFRPSRFVAIDSDIDGKLAAVGAFASQTPVRGYLDEDLIRSTARYWSRFGDSGYAEAFEVIRESEGLPMRQAHGATTVPGAAMTRAAAASAAPAGTGRR